MAQGTLTGRAAAGEVFHTRLSSCGKLQPNQPFFLGEVGWVGLDGPLIRILACGGGGGG